MEGCPSESAFIVNCASQVSLSTVTTASEGRLSDIRVAAPHAPGVHASDLMQEYFKAVHQDVLHYPVYTMCFPGPAVYAKAAR